MDDSRVGFYEKNFFDDMIRVVLIIMIKFPNYIFGIITELIKSQELMRFLVLKINRSDLYYSFFTPRLTQRNKGYVGVSMSFWKLCIHQSICPKLFPQNKSSSTITVELEILLKDLLGRRSLMERYNLHIFPEFFRKVLKELETERLQLSSSF